MTVQEIVRLAIPEADDSLCEYVLWDRTAFPFEKVTPLRIYRAAYRLRVAGENGIRLCELCDNEAKPGTWTCKECEDALNGARERRKS